LSGVELAKTEGNAVAWAMIEFAKLFVAIFGAYKTQIGAAASDAIYQ
jgi:hypothetical protein